MAKKVKKATPFKKGKAKSKKEAVVSTPSVIGNVLSFRWLKKMMHSRFGSMDLLDQWILKKRFISLFL